MQSPVVEVIEPITACMLLQNQIKRVSNEHLYLFCGWRN